MDKAYLEGRIAVTKAIIEAYENAIIALSATGVMTYTLDTGQSRQVVTRQDIVRMTRELDGLYNRLCIFQRRLNGGATIVARPAF